MLIEFEAFHSLLQIELIHVVESHQMPVTSKYVHFVFINTDTLPVPCAGFLPDNKSMTIVVYYLLLDLLVI